MKTLKFTIEYNGAGFFGWQKQSGKRTVQGVLEDTFKKLTGEDVAFEGSGRTDRGVHALGQVASVKTNTLIPIKNLKGAFNNLLPEDVQIKRVERANDDFHARFCAKRKTYAYYVQVGGQKSAIKHDTLAFYPYENVDLEQMRETAKMLVGKHNFHAFCSSDTNVTNFEREIFDFSVTKRGRIFRFEVCGNGFLYNMVRILVGTLLENGRGKISRQNIEKALVTGERSLTGTTMSPCGLFLKEVRYE